MNPCDQDFDDMDRRNGRGGAFVGLLLVAVAAAMAAGGVWLLIEAFA